jgi:hypothetical protein
MHVASTPNIVPGFTLLLPLAALTAIKIRPSQKE